MIHYIYIYIYSIKFSWLFDDWFKIYYFNIFSNNLLYMLYDIMPLNTYSLYADLSWWSKVQAFLEPYRLSPCTGDHIPCLFPSPITWLGREGNNWEREKGKWINPTISMYVRQYLRLMWIFFKIFFIFKNLLI